MEGRALRAAAGRRTGKPGPGTGGCGRRTDAHPVSRSTHDRGAHAGRRNRGIALGAGARARRCATRCSPARTLRRRCGPRCSSPTTDANLYVAFRCHDPTPVGDPRPTSPIATRAFNDDFVGVVLDTFNDQRRAFEFFVNPLGVQMDLIMDDVNQATRARQWNGIWDSAGEINETGASRPRSRFRSANSAFTRTLPASKRGASTCVGSFHPRAQRSRISNNTQDRNRELLSLPVEQNFRAIRERGARVNSLEVVPTVDGRAHGLAARLAASVRSRTRMEAGLTVCAGALRRI